MAFIRWTAAACAVGIAVLAFVVQKLALVRDSGGLPCVSVEMGSSVIVTFLLTRDDDGTVVDSSNESGVLEFVCGNGEVLAAMESGVLGMRVGDTRSFPFGGESGFGDRDEAGVIEVQRDVLDEDLEVGKFTTVSTEGGHRHAVVLFINSSHATLDFNHPLAGLELTMTVTLSGCTQPATRPDVEVTARTAGDGVTMPQDGDIVTIHYTGAFAESGNIFDSSEERGKPLQVHLGKGEVIRGLEIGLQKLTLGEKATLHIPAQLAYGSQEARNAVSLNKDVIFEVDVLSIEKQHANTP
eukprot:2055657-Amphidinium_carterae.1